MMTTQNQPEPEVRSIDRFLALTSITLIIAAVICFFIVIIGTPLGADFNAAWGQIVFGIMYFGLPIGVVLFLTLIITNTVRRSRSAKQAKK